MTNRSVTIAKFGATSSSLALAAFLAGCATAPAQEAKAPPSQPTLGMGAATGAPSDLDGAVRQAQLQRAAGDIDGASHTLSQLVLFAPDDPRVLGEYAKVLVDRGRTNDALAFLKRAIELNPGDWTLYSAQGIAFDQRSEYTMAQVSYGRALALRPGEPTVLSNNALSHMQAGDLAGAETLLAQAAQGRSDNPRIAENLAMVRRMRGTQAAANATAIASAQKPASAVRQANSTPSPAPIPQTAQAAPRPPVQQMQVPQTAPVQQTRAPIATLAVPDVKQPLPAPQPNATAAPQRLSSLETLKADPSVMMAPIPKAEGAPKSLAATTPAPAPLSPQMAALQRAGVVMAALPKEEEPNEATKTVVKRKVVKTATQTASAEPVKTETVKTEITKTETTKAAKADIKPVQKMASEEPLTRLRPALPDMVASKK